MIDIKVILHTLQQMNNKIAFKLHKLHQMRSANLIYVPSSALVDNCD